MQKTEFLSRIESLLELDPATLQGDERLADLQGWDSLALMGFIAFVDGTFQERFSGKQIAACTTVNDLAGLLGDRISA